MNSKRKIPRNATKAENFKKEKVKDEITEEIEEEMPEEEDEEMYEETPEEEEIEKVDENLNEKSEEKKLIVLTANNIEEFEYELFSDEILKINNRSYYPIKGYRNPKLGNTRVKNYYCNKHETDSHITYYLVGQMEAVNKHYVKYHPEKIYYLKNITGKKEFLLSRMRLLISMLENSTGDLRKDFVGNFRNILTKVLFNKKVITMTKNWIKNKDKLGLFTCGIINIKPEILHVFVDIYIEIIDKLLNVLKSENYYCPYDDRAEEEENIKFKSILDCFKYRFLPKNPFFLISMRDKIDNPCNKHRNIPNKNMVNVNNNGLIPTKFEKSQNVDNIDYRDSDNNYDFSEEKEKNGSSDIPINSQSSINQLKDDLNNNNKDYKNYTSCNSKDVSLFINTHSEKKLTEYLMIRKDFERIHKTKFFQHFIKLKQKLKKEKEIKLQRILNKKRKREKEEQEKLKEKPKELIDEKPNGMSKEMPEEMREELIKEKQKEKPNEISKEKPKEIPKEKLKEKPKEKPKEIPKEKSNNNFIIQFDNNSCKLIDKKPEDNNIIDEKEDEKEKEKTRAIINDLLKGKNELINKKKENIKRLIESDKDYQKTNDNNIEIERNKVCHDGSNTMVEIIAKNRNPCDKEEKNDNEKNFEIHLQNYMLNKKEIKKEKETEFDNNIIKENKVKKQDIIDNIIPKEKEKPPKDNKLPILEQNKEKKENDKKDANNNVNIKNNEEKNSNKEKNYSKYRSLNEFMFEYNKFMSNK